MLHIKLFSFLLTAVIAIVAYRQLRALVGRFQAELARARVRPTPAPGQVRLRQDPRTGIYYPEK